MSDARTACDAVAAVADMTPDERIACLSSLVQSLLDLAGDRLPADVEDLEPLRTRWKAPTPRGPSR